MKRRATRPVQLSDSDRLEHVHPRRLRECVERGHDWQRPASGDPAEPPPDHGAAQCARCGTWSDQHPQEADHG